MNCAICSGSNIQCSKCEILSLRKTINGLQSQLDKYTNILSDNLSLKYWQVVDIDKCFKRSKKPIPYNYKDKLSTAKFLTITFDPAKFGIQPLEDERKNYILLQLQRMIVHEMILELYGSFEYHKSGIVHAHCIIITNDESAVKQYIQPKFTDNRYNRKAIDLGPAKYPQAEEYINKESVDYFLHIPNRSERSESKQARPGMLKSLGCLSIHGPFHDRHEGKDGTPVNDLDFGL